MSKPKETGRICGLFYDGLNRHLSYQTNEFNLKTFKTGIDVLLPKKHWGDDIGYV